MKFISGISELHHAISHPVVTIGNFDGVHLGHQKIIEIALEKARRKGGHCVAYTFRPHPQVALRPGIPLHLLSTYDEKLELLESLGVDFIIEEPFNREFSTTEPERFFKDILLGRIGVESIVVGYDFAFGKERHGHLETLSSFCHSSGVELTVVQPQKVQTCGQDQVVSSSKIRQLLLAGEVNSAKALLGRSFSYRGWVIPGESRGRKLGFPTANMKLENKMALPFGVYATWAMVDGKRYPSVTHIGVRPTFQIEGSMPTPLIETHLLNETLELYGKNLVVLFEQRIRGEIKFSGIDQLKGQISTDLKKAAQLLNPESPELP